MYRCNLQFNDILFFIHDEKERNGVIKIITSLMANKYIYT